MLLDYFDEVGRLSDTLKRHLVLNLKRTLNIARKEPTVLVTTLRIIEREEKADETALQVKLGLVSPKISRLCFTSNLNNFMFNRDLN